MTDTSPIDLLPRLEACPLCGGEASVISLSECRHYVRCMSCPQHFRAKADAIAAWNTRPKPALGDEDRALVKQLRMKAQQSSEISRQMAEAKSLRQDDNLERRTDLYMWQTPEQTLEWQAADRIEARAALDAALLPFAI